MLTNSQHDLQAAPKAAPSTRTATSLIRDHLIQHPDIEPFTRDEMSDTLGISRTLTGSALYSMARRGLLRAKDRNGRTYTYELCDSPKAYTFRSYKSTEGRFSTSRPLPHPLLVATEPLIKELVDLAVCLDEALRSKASLHDVPTIDLLGELARRLK